MENFIDVFTTLVRLLYVYAERGVIKRGKLSGWLCGFIEIATKGGTTYEGEVFEGYLATVVANGGRGKVLRDRCDETNYLGAVNTALLIARRIRAIGEKKAAKEYLPTVARMTEDVINEYGLHRPKPEKIQEALTAYRMLPDAEIHLLLRQLD
jgi:hypothetical protein